MKNISRVREEMGGGGMRGQVKQPNSAQEPTSTPPSLSLEVTPNCSAFTFHL